jgi:hypothetical protein
MFDENFKKRWQKLSLIEQLANIGSEIYRVKMLLEKYADKADLTQTMQTSNVDAYSVDLTQSLQKSISVESAFYFAKSALLENSIIRALELFNLTLSGHKNKGRLKEVARAKELFLDAVYNEAKEYKTTLDDLDKYFYQFALILRGK